MSEVLSGGLQDPINGACGNSFRHSHGLHNAQRATPAQFDPFVDLEQSLEGATSNSECINETLEW